MPLLAMALLLNGIACAQGDMTVRRKKATERVKEALLVSPWADREAF